MSESGAERATAVRRAYGWLCGAVYAFAMLLAILPVGPPGPVSRGGGGCGTAVGAVLRYPADSVCGDPARDRMAISLLMLFAAAPLAVAYLGACARERRD